MCHHTHADEIRVLCPSSSCQGYRRGHCYHHHPTLTRELQCISHWLGDTRRCWCYHTVETEEPAGTYYTQWGMIGLHSCTRVCVFVMFLTLIPVLLSWLQVSLLNTNAFARPCRGALSTWRSVRENAGSSGYKALCSLCAYNTSISNAKIEAYKPLLIPVFMHAYLFKSGKIETSRYTEGYHFRGRISSTRDI